MLEKVGQEFCSDWFHRSNENHVKALVMEIVSDLQYFCKKALHQYLSLTWTPRFWSKIYLISYLQSICILLTQPWNQ